MHQPVQQIKNLTLVIAGIAWALLAACRQPVQYRSEKTTKISPSFKVFDLDKVDGSPVADKMHNPEAMYSCPVYAQPDTTAKQLTVFQAFTQLDIKGRVERYYQDTVKTEGQRAYLSNGSHIWYQVQVNNQAGYIAEKYVAKFTFTDSVRKVSYLIGVSAPADTGGFARMVLKYDTQQKKLLSSVSVPANNSGNFSAVKVEHPILKNVSYMLRIDEDMEYSGGSQTSQLIADGDAGMVALPQTNVGYDDGEGIRQKVLYVPAKGEDGKLRFYVDADIHNHMKWASYYVAAWNAYGIPADEILMYAVWKGQKELDKNNEPVVTKGSKQKFKSLVTRSVFYRWDGKGFKMVGIENW